MPKNIESVWADGVVPNAKVEDHLTKDEITNVCIGFMVDKVLKGKGYTVISFTNNAKATPNLIVKKGTEVYALCVVPCIYPKYTTPSNELRMQIVERCCSQKTIPVFCPMLIGSNDAARAKAGLLLRGDLFRLNLIGAVILTNSKTQDLSPNSLDFKF